ncbi:MAG: LysM peptidoglycan-binding domain-containing protein [Spirochaetaceae bacterium]|nr:LysM peptidoglycan-binding domain-containing protein [Spirochaetaceae bacterium]
MGRNLFRRSFLILLLFPISISAQTLPAEQNIGISESYEKKHLPSLKNLRSEMSFSFPFEMNEEIDRYIKIYTSDDKLAYLQRALDRAAPFRSFIQSLIKEYNLPAEIFYLPIIESAYRVDAISRSGAVGMWQFMANSIDPYDIEVNDWRDDRKDFWRATDGALKKLEYNYIKTGSWDLALAAYNCGLNGLRRIMQSSGIDNYWILKEKGLLPYETAYYLPKFLAVSIICSYSGRYGFHSGWEENLQWQRIDLDRSVDIRLISEQSGIDYNLLSTGNAELIYNVTPPADSGYKLKIPVSFADSLIEILEESDGNFMEFYRYNIKTGDTLSEISQYYKVPLSLIYRYNEGLSPRYLRAGQIVIIPALFKVDPYRSSEELNISFDETYFVQKGDSLWSISGIYKITPELLASRNRLPIDGTLNIGMKLSVPKK